MKTIEIRPADGGLDAEMFATDLSNGMRRALKRDDIEYDTDGDWLTVIDGKSPRWL